MHEMSIVEGLLEAVESELLTRPNTRVRVVRLQVGRLRQVEPSMLEFCYRAAVNGTHLEGSRLEVEKLEAIAHCRRCEIDFVVEQSWFECPHCHTSDAKMVTGKELNLTSIDLEFNRN